MGNNGSLSASDELPKRDALVCIVKGLLVCSSTIRYRICYRVGERKFTRLASYGVKSMWSMSKLKCQSVSQRLT